MNIAQIVDAEAGQIDFYVVPSQPIQMQLPRVKPLLKSRGPRQLSNRWASLLKSIEDAHRWLSQGEIREITGWKGHSLGCTLYSLTMHGYIQKRNGKPLLYGGVDL